MSRKETTRGIETFLHKYRRLFTKHSATLPSTHRGTNSLRGSDGICTRGTWSVQYSGSLCPSSQTRCRSFGMMLFRRMRSNPFIYSLHLILSGPSCGKSQQQTVQKLIRWIDTPQRGEAGLLGGMWTWDRVPATHNNTAPAVNVFWWPRTISLD